MITQKVHQQEPGNKGDYSVSEPHQDLLLTKSRWQKQKAVTQNQKFITKNQKIKVITRYQNLISKSKL